MIDYEILKDAIESLRTPAKLDSHPLAEAPFVQQFLSQHPGYEGLAPGRRLGLILADLWRENFFPGDRRSNSSANGIVSWCWRPGISIRFG